MIGALITIVFSGEEIKAEIEDKNYEKAMLLATGLEDYKTAAIHLTYPIWKPIELGGEAITKTWAYNDELYEPEDSVPGEDAHDRIKKMAAELERRGLYR